MYLLNVSSFRLEIIYLLLAVVGILIILACVGAYLFNYGISLREKVQEIKAFGADMKISVITVFVLVGVILIIPTVWQNFSETYNTLSQLNQSLEKEKQQLEKERDTFKEKLEKSIASLYHDQLLLLELEGIGVQRFSEKNDFSVRYFTNNSEFPQLLAHDLVSDGRIKRLRVQFKNINSDTEFPRLEVIQSSTGQKWVFENLRPASVPVFTLKKEI